MRIYISGAISNVPDFMARFDEAEKELLTKYPDVQVINPARLHSVYPDWFTWDDYMKLSIAELSTANVIYMLQGWEVSRGANRELGYAIGKGLDVMYQ